METEIERISTVECRVRVEIPWKDVSPRLQQKLRDLRRRARLPGFRPGKVPPHLINRMFGKGVREELARDLVQETFQTAVANHDTTPLTQPVLEESSLEREQPFTYAARFEVPPQIEPKDYKGLDVRRRPVALDVEKVDAELERMRLELTELQPIPETEQAEATKPGDIWTVDVEGTLGDTPLSRTDLKIEIGLEEGEFVPGLGAALADTLRSDVGSAKSLEFVPPADRLKAEFHGQTAMLTVGLRQVQVKHVPELDDDFARDTGEAESLDELRGKVEEKVREEDGATAEREARRRLVEDILERNDFEPAPSMVGREVAAQVDQTKRQLAQQGLSLEQAGTSEGRLAEQIRSQATFNVKAYLLLDAIGKTEDIDVTDEEFDKELEEMAEESGQNLARMRASMERNNQLVLLRAQMREERILDFLMGEAKVTEAPDPALDDQIEAAAAKAAQPEDEHTGSRRRRRKKAGVESGGDETDAQSEDAPADEPAATPAAKKKTKKKAAKKAAKKTSKKAESSTKKKAKKKAKKKTS